MNEQPYETSEPIIPKAATRKEFLHLPENKKLRKNINAAGIICYVCAGITLLATLAAGNLFGLLDVLILLGMGLGIHLKQSMACAIILTVYAAISFLLSIAAGSAGGWLVLLAGIFGIVYIASLNKAWKAYQAE